MSLKELARKAEAESEKKFHKPEAEPKYVRMGWQGKEWTGLLRILTPDQELQRDRMMALWIGGQAVESFPNYAYWQALATIRVMWPDLPDWMDWLVTTEKAAAMGLAEEVDKFEAAFRLEVVGPGEKGPGSAGFSISSSDVAEATDSVGGG